MDDLNRTPLYDLHQELGARMVPFAGYEMPVQFAGVMAEHLHTREKAGLFDVSHMGQLRIAGADYDTIALALERLIPVDILGLGHERQRYGFLTTPQGGLLDDLMLANRGNHVFMVVNGAVKAADLAHLRANLPPSITVKQEQRALLALQGPRAEDALAALNPDIRKMRFMDVTTLDLNGTEAWISRSGYTGEDGFEISVPEDAAAPLARELLALPDVAPIGLGARDSLRLEAGLCLYGHDIDTATTPIEAGLGWAIQKVRRIDGERAAGFPGCEIILHQMEDRPSTLRVGLLPEGRAPMREGVALFATQDASAPIGRITSGGFGPTLSAPVAMGYVNAKYATAGTRLWGELRGKRLPVTVARLPFTPARFKR